jgi:CDP-4-dehydro-6-deoxyglucose reductase, E1
MKNKRVFYAEANYGREEIDAVVDVLENQRHALVAGNNCLELERLVAKEYGKQFGLMTNSGSSANLLAIQSAQLEEDSEVITPALTFSTTVAPLVQSGLTPVFVDIEAKTLQASLTEIEGAINNKTSAVMVPNLIGNMIDWEALRAITKKNELLLIEDSCDTIGYKINGKKGNPYSDITTTSFYASHIITGAGTGGMACFNDKGMLNKAKSLRSWGRRSSLYGETEDVNRRFSIQLDGFDYDDKYIFDDIGYNLIPSEISAAFALVQYQKLENNIAIRKRNFSYMASFLSQYPEVFQLFTPEPKAEINWLAFPVVLKGKLEGKRRDFQIFLERRGIQTRTIFTGNIMKQPIMNGLKYREFNSDFSVANNVMKNGALLGCHNGLEIDDLEYVTKVIIDFIESNG